MSIALQVKVREMELSLANAQHRIELLEADVKALAEAAAAHTKEPEPGAQPEAERATLSLPKKN